METPMWSFVAWLWILSMAAAAAIGSAWEWTGLMLLGVAVLWISAWAAVVTLHGFLVPKKP